MAVTSSVPHLLDVDLNITARCNLRCDFCSVAIQPVAQSCDELTLSEIKSLLKQFDGIGTQVVRIVGGEPFVRRDIDDILQAVGSYGFFSSVLTNATVMKRRHLEVIRDCGIDVVSFSVDGHTADLHDASRGMPRAFQRLSAMVDDCNRFGIRHRMMTVVTTATLPYLKDLCRFAIEHGFEALNFIMLGLGAAANVSAQRFPTYEQWSQAIADLTRHLAATRPSIAVSILFPHEDPVPIELQEPLARAGLLREMHEVWKVAPSEHASWGSSKCLAGQSSIAIMPNGDVFGCDLMRELPHLRAGNVRQDSVATIFRDSPVLHRLRENTKVHACHAPGPHDKSFSCGQCRAGLQHMRPGSSEVFIAANRLFRAPSQGSMRQTNAPLP